jgi:putative transposase
VRISPGNSTQASALVGFIDSHRDRFGVDPVCAVLEFPASTYYAAKKREHRPSPRDVRDEQTKEQIMRVWEDRKKGRRVYGARKVWLQLRREGIEVARCTVERLMRELGIAGVSARRKKPRTTVPDGTGSRLSDLLERNFTAPEPNRRWVADITYVDTACGFAYTAFVTDLFSRKIVGRQVADHLRAGLALDALEMDLPGGRDRPSPGGTAEPYSRFPVLVTALDQGGKLCGIGVVLCPSGCLRSTLRV